MSCRVQALHNRRRRRRNFGLRRQYPTPTREQPSTTQKRAHSKDQEEPLFSESPLCAKETDRWYQEQGWREF
jgi:hypothetical protein